MIGIYLIINCHNDKIYVGSAANIEVRIKRHIRDLESNRHSNKYLQRAWNKYEGNFHFCIVEECELNKLREIEQIWIDNTECYFKENGYNLIKNAIGAELGNQLRKGILHSEETKLKMSLDRKGKPKSEQHKLAIKNRIMTPEHCKNISQGQKGRVQSEETKRKISEKNKLYVRTEAYRINMSKIKKGVIFTEEHKQKMRQSAKARWAKNRF